MSNVLYLYSCTISILIQACLAKTMGNVRRRFPSEFETNSWNRKGRLILFFAEDNGRRCYRPFFFVTPKPFLAVFSRFIFELDIGDRSIPHDERMDILLIRTSESYQHWRGFTSRLAFLLFTRPKARRRRKSIALSPYVFVPKRAKVNIRACLYCGFLGHPPENYY